MVHIHVAFVSLTMQALHSVSPGLAPFHVSPLGIWNQHGVPLRSRAEVWV